MSLDLLCNGLYEANFLVLKNYSISRSEITGLYRIVKPSEKRVYLAQRIEKNKYFYYDIFMSYKVKK